MIEGLKVTVQGTEVSTLAKKQSIYHAEKASTYRKQLEAFDAMNVPGTSMRPGEDARNKITTHEAQAAEMQFIAEHVDMKEVFVLDSSDLHRLGVAYRGY